MSAGCWSVRFISRDYALIPHTHEISFLVAHMEGLDVCLWKSQHKKVPKQVPFSHSPKPSPVSLSVLWPSCPFNLHDRKRKHRERERERERESLRERRSVSLAGHAGRPTKKPSDGLFRADHNVINVHDIIDCAQTSYLLSLIDVPTPSQHS
jgi:hypothetical protein